MHECWRAPQVVTRRWPDLLIDLGIDTKPESVNIKRHPISSSFRAHGMYSRRERQLITDLYPVVSKFTAISNFAELKDEEIGVRDYLKKVRATILVVLVFR